MGVSVSGQLLHSGGCPLRLFVLHMPCGTAASWYLLPLQDQAWCLFTVACCFEMCAWPWAS